MQVEPWSFEKNWAQQTPTCLLDIQLIKKGRLQHLFWCDGESQLNYEIFGDALAFDVIYHKNNYNCSFVIFFRYEYDLKVINRFLALFMS